MEENIQLQLANDFVLHTHRHVFLTGKAGTGKTTFLHNLKKQSSKRMVVVAPTGVAAINAGGVTIHSMFQLAFGPNVPGAQRPEPRRMNREKLKLIRSIDLLVIDEISMVRADLLDGIDEVLRTIRRNHKPFGGVQLLMIGDLHQLSPVVKDDEWALLRDYYDTPYFFSSRALQETEVIKIELKHIYRQSDEYFISLLHKVRHNQMDVHTLEEINSRYIPNFFPDDDEGYITLTTHNATASNINKQKLEQLDTPVKKYFANVIDDFPEYNFPTEQELQLKKGAQVMFVKNDSPTKKFYNGKIGKVVSLSDEEIIVRCPGDDEDINVPRMVWENIRYSLNDANGLLEEKAIGSFTQFPLKLAWAITIHKSQGLTFDKAIIDAGSSFAFGQVYVALSRCRTFEGMVLSTPLSYDSIKTDDTISTFSNEVERRPPTVAELLESKIEFQKELLQQLFDFDELMRRQIYLIKTITEHQKILNDDLLPAMQMMFTESQQEIFSVADKFKFQMAELMKDDLPAEENEALQLRIKKAASYFADKINLVMYSIHKNLKLESDNAAIKKQLQDADEKFQFAVYTKLKMMEATANGFNALLLQKAIADADNHFVYTKIKKSTAGKSNNEDHPQLYDELKSWRDDLAEENDSPVYMVLPTKTLQAIAKHLPTSMEQLLSIKGLGKIKAKRFGNEVLDMVNRYCKANNLSAQFDLPIKTEKVKTKKENSALISFQMFSAGKTIDEIAAERNFAATTIEGHLAQYVRSGELSIDKFIDEVKRKIAEEFFISHPDATLTEAMIELENKFSFGELKMIVAALQHQELIPMRMKDK